VAPELTSLVDDYRIVLGHYVDRISRFDPDSQARENKAHRRLAADIVEKLDKLDELRESVRPKRDGIAAPMPE
jgi:hypothetical protein